ncbi:MAG: TerC/Alx family metal homeostasis membrane protein [Anaerovoracaceae bacterium]|nr:TerC/Alx family metal homeostasis membrane protein [Bacillota bacterium]MDY3954048.1 TerC/Alx family metal homeostasis membrane protein [Anaerovoracaceae bacterium]
MEHRTIKAYKWVFIWIGLAGLCNLAVWYFMGTEKALQFLAGYLIEFSLSMDNLFVFLTIFMSFGIAEHAQHRVLGWGIIGAIILRLIFIMLGVQIVSRFEWVLYLFGVLLIINGIKMFRKTEKVEDPHDSPIIKTVSRVLPVSPDFEGEKFFTKIDGKKMVTPLFAILILVECSDIIFAIDSVPAVFSVSTDPLIVYLSNIFAILGLRQLYFVLEHLHERFSYVKYGVATILTFTGIKLGIGVFGWHIAIVPSILFIFVVLTLSIVISIVLSGRKSEKGSLRK